MNVFAEEMGENRLEEEAGHGAIAEQGVITPMAEDPEEKIEALAGPGLGLLFLGFIHENLAENLLIGIRQLIKRQKNHKDDSVN